MKASIKQRWLKALRNGSFVQGHDQLRSTDADSNRTPTYCCLGVLCELHRKSTKQKGWDANDTYQGAECYPPAHVIRWAGLADNATPDGDINVVFKGAQTKLSVLNDGDTNVTPKALTFKQIADVIEKQL